MTKEIIYRRLLLLAAIPAMMLASCSKEEMAGEPGGSPNTQNEEICFEIGFAPMDVASQKDPHTRVATDTEFKSTWEDGDEIGVFAVKQGKPLAGSGNLFHNVKLTYSSANGGKWTAAEPMYWPAGGTKLDFYAYYPYDESLANLSELKIKLPEDQSAMIDKDQPVYNRNDVLWCKNITGIGKNEGAVSLPFSHMLAMVQVKVSSSMLGNYPPEALDVWLDGASLEGQIDIKNGGIANIQNSKRIKMYACPTNNDAGTYAYRALVMPKDIEAGTSMFRFEYNGTDLLKNLPLATSLELKSGRVETYDMTFPFTSVTVSSNDRLADLIPADKLGTVTHLRVLGEMTADDFMTIRDKMTNITSLDLSGATVKGNMIPGGALYEKQSLTEFVFPRGVTSIGSSAFDGCSSLNGNLTIPKGVTTIGGYAFKGCSSLNGDLTIPEGVTSIGFSAFEGCSSLTGNLTIPKGVTTIGGYAFSNCSSLNGNLTIPEGVTTIGSSAFRGCSNLNGNLTIPEGVTTIGDYAFSNCSSLNGNLTIPEGVKTIGRFAFDGCSSLNGNLTIPKGVTTIGDYAFSNCSSLNGNLTIPEGVKTIDRFAFSGCNSLTGDLRIPKGVTSIGEHAFDNCRSLNGNLTIPEGVTTIGKSTFSDCKSLTGNLTIPTSVTSIGSYAFSGCSGFTGKLTIPEGVTTIGDYAFNNCSGLFSIDCYIKNPDINYGKNVFKFIPNTTPFYVPAGTLDLYNNKEPWNYFKFIKEMKP